MRGMKLDDLWTVAGALEIYPVLFCASLVGWSRRLRYWWLDWSIEFANNFYLVWNAEKCICTVRGEPCRDSCAKWLRRGSQWLGEDMDHPHPTLVRWIKRRSPPLQPRGIELCTAAELTEWARLGYIVPPYQLREINLVLRPDGNFTLTDAKER